MLTGDIARYQIQDRIREADAYRRSRRAAGAPRGQVRRVLRAVAFAVRAIRRQPFTPPTSDRRLTVATRV